MRFMLTFLVIESSLIFSSFTDGELEFSFSNNAYISSSHSTRVDNQNKTRLEAHFKTIHQSGVILYAESRDFMCLSLQHGTLRLTMSHKNPHQLSDTFNVNLGSDLCDGKWHFVKVFLNGNRVIINLDNERFRHTITEINNGHDTRLYTSVGGIDRAMTFKFQDIYKLPHFHGCLAKVLLNGRNMLKGFYNSRNKDIKISGTIKSGCEGNDGKGILGFTESSSYLKLSPIIRNMLNIKFSFRTYVDSGKILRSQASGFLFLWITLGLNSGRLELKIQLIQGATNKVFPFVMGKDLADGNWHIVELTVKSDNRRLTLVLDGKSTSWVKPSNMRAVSLTFQTIIFGNGGTKKGFVGCLKDLTANNINTSTIQGLAHYKLKEASCPINHCFPNPCRNEGTCINQGSRYTCNCNRTMYRGTMCSLPLYRSTCREYFKLGLKTDSKCLVDPGYNGSTMHPFDVLCKMSNGSNPVTVITNKKTGWQTADQFAYKLSDIAFDSTMDYSTSLSNVKAVISRSTRCRQFLAVNHSMGVVSKYNNVFWMSANERHDPFAFVSNGFLTTKKLLPVVGIQFHIPSKPAGLSYKLGPLECFGTKKPSFPLPPSVNTMNLLNTVCKPLIKERNHKKTARPVNRTFTVKRKDSHIEENKQADYKTTTVFDQTQTIPSTQATGHEHHTVSSANRATSHVHTRSKEESEQNYLLWYIAIFVAIVLVLMFVLFGALLVRVKRHTAKEKKKSRQSTNADDLELEPNLWMTLNAGGYDPKTGKFTCGEMYGGPHPS